MSQPPPDDHWQWDGERWQYGGEVVPDGSPQPPEDGSGQWVWDGTQWQPVVG